MREKINGICRDGRDHDRLFSDFVPPIAVAQRRARTILCYLRERTANGDAVRNTGLSRDGRLD